MNTIYEIRSARGTPVYAFESEVRAKEEIKARAKQVPGLRLFRVTRSEEEIAL